MPSFPPPVVLCYSGHDPTGGAGIQADLEALGRVGCHACSIVTALTAQDTRDVQRVVPQNVEDLRGQARLLLDDLPVRVVKIGMLGSAAIAEAVAGLLREMPGVPVVLDPILAAGGGSPLAREDLIAVLRDQLLPLATVVTPNTPEAQTLAAVPEAGPDAWAEGLLRRGCGHVLITGTHEEGDAVVNRWYGPGGPRSWQWERLPHTYHGSGCTLAAALAGYLALGFEAEEAAYRAQDFTWRALRSGYAAGHGQHLPNRWRVLP